MKKILLVDDDKVITDMYRTKFKELGWEVVVENNVAAAMATLKDGLHPDLVVLDIIMPGQNGLEFLEWIRKEKKLSAVKVVLLTNLDYQKEAAEMIPLKVSGYFLKAKVTPGELGRKIEEIFSQ